MASRTDRLEDMVSVKVDNLPFSVNEEQLRGMFDKYGQIGDVYIPRDHETQKQRGFGFVRYYERSHALDAIKALDGTEVDGREIRCLEARYGQPPSSRRAGDYRGGPRVDSGHQPAATYSYPAASDPYAGAYGGYSAPAAAYGAPAPAYPAYPTPVYPSYAPSVPAPAPAYPAAVAYPGYAAPPAYPPAAPGYYGLFWK